MYFGSRFKKNTASCCASTVSISMNAMFGIEANVTQLIRAFSACFFETKLFSWGDAPGSPRRIRPVADLD
jgi:hypothetical protein